jgi:serine phosphatase RsbU (regulator of sigma subunit)
MNAESAFFGERSLRRSLAECAGLSARDTTQTVLRDVREFVQGAAQSDDITAMSVKWTPADES